MYTEGTIRQSNKLIFQVSGKSGSDFRSLLEQKQQKQQGKVTMQVISQTQPREVVTVHPQEQHAEDTSQFGRLLASTDSHTPATGIERRRNRRYLTPVETAQLHIVRSAIRDLH
jgi:hypothetical protein